VLVAIAVANAVVSFYYYMLVVKQAYIVEESAGSAIALGILPKLSMWILAGLLLALGLLPFAADWLAARSAF
jgi:NADH:ubiquinone oxidoreductase subunit 2 (subunit N)